MPYKEVHRREAAFGRPLTMSEHVEIIESRLWVMRVRFYVIIGLLVASVLIGGSLSFYVYGQVQDRAIRIACIQANARWGRLRQNLIDVALVRQPDETNKEFKERSVRTLSLVDGLFNVDCNDPSKRVPAPLPRVSTGGSQ